MIRDLIQITQRLKTQISLTQEAVDNLHQLKKTIADSEFILRLIRVKLQDLEKLDPELAREFQAQISALINEERTAKKPPLLINSDCNNTFGAALALDTASALAKGKITKSYPVSFRDNPQRPANTKNYLEFYPELKPSGEPFISAQDAYYFYSKDLDKNEKYRLMVEILTAKLEQHPRLTTTIERCGGKSWIASCSHYNLTAQSGEPVPFEENSFWTGDGLESKLLVALIEAYSSLKSDSKPIAIAPLPPIAETKVELHQKAFYYPQVSTLGLLFTNVAKARDWRDYLVNEQNFGRAREITSSTCQKHPREMLIAGLSLAQATEIAQLYDAKALEANPPRMNQPLVRSPKVKAKNDIIAITPWLECDLATVTTKIYVQTEAVAIAWANYLHQELYVGNDVEIKPTPKGYQAVFAGVTQEEAKEIANLYPEISEEKLPTIEAA